MYDTIIIGAGPSGLTAALYLLRANKKVLILESNTYGGQIINATDIENYPGIMNISGFDFATNLYNQVMNLGGNIKYEKVIDVDDSVHTENNQYEAKTIIIAAGLERRKLNIEDEDRLVGKGISYCATCDGNFYKDKIVAVIGGGNTAFEEAIYLSDIASKVYLIHRNSNFKAEDKYIENVKSKNNIEIMTDKEVIKLIGDDKLKQIGLNDNSILDVDGLFVAIGQIPKSEIFKKVVDVDEYGYILTKDDVCTKTKNVFAIGDIRKKELRQLTTSVSDGAIAAKKVIEYLKMGEI